MFNLARSTSRVCNIADRKLFFTSLRLLKNLSADSTVAGIVKNILKIIQTFGNNSHTSHTGYKGGDHCFKVLWKYCKWLVSPVWFRNLRISGYVLLILNSHLIRPCISLRRKFNNQQNAQHTFAVHYKHLRPALQLLVDFTLFSCYLTHMPNI